MEWDVTREDYEKFCVARESTQDYDESGWAALVDGDKACLLHISHCSCYGTFDGGHSVDWVGSLDELLKMAAEDADPAMPPRKIDDSDYDAGYLRSVYSQLLKLYPRN